MTSVIRCGEGCQRTWYGKHSFLDLSIIKMHMFVALTPRLYAAPYATAPHCSIGNARAQTGAIILLSQYARQLLSSVCLFHTDFKSYSARIWRRLAVQRRIEWHTKCICASTAAAVGGNPSLGCLKPFKIPSGLHTRPEVNGLSHTAALYVFRF